MDLVEVELVLHDEARDHERRGDDDGARLLRCAGDLVAEARRDLRGDMPRQRVISVADRVVAILR